MAKKKNKRINPKAVQGAKKINGRLFFKGKLVILEPEIKKMNIERRKEVRDYRRWRVPGLVWCSDIDIKTGLPNPKLPEELIDQIIQKKKEIIKVNYDELVAEDPEDIAVSLEKQLAKAYGVEKIGPILKKTLKNLQYLAANAFIPEEDFEFIMKRFRFNSGKSLVKKNWQEVLMIRFQQDDGLGIDTNEGIAMLFTQTSKSGAKKFAISDVAMKTNQETWYLDHVLIMDGNIYEFVSPLLNYKKQPKPKLYLQITNNGQIKTKKSKEEIRQEKKAQKERMKKNAKTNQGEQGRPVRPQQN